MRKFFEKYFSGLNRNVFLLALSSLFGDVSSEMLYPVLPIYLTQNLKAGGSIIGIIDGIAQATQNIIQGFSGYFADKLQMRKPIAVGGYILAAISKPFIGLAGSWPVVLAARFADRVGAGARSAPRDALVASSVDEKNRGKAFGLEGFGDNLGAFLGPLITVCLFFFFKMDIHYVFFLAFIPGLVAVLMVWLTKENKTKGGPKTKLDIHPGRFPKSYWKYMVVTAIFGLGNSSNSFLVLQLRNSGLSLVSTVLVYAIFNLAAALVSYPAGSLSDRFGRKPILLIGFIIFFISYCGFARFQGMLLVSILFVFYGLFQGIYRSVGKSFASDFVPEPIRASSIGLYSAVVGTTALIASLVAGQLWDKVGHTAVFVYGAIFSLAGIIVTLILIPGKRLLRSGEE